MNSRFTPHLLSKLCICIAFITTLNTAIANCSTFIKTFPYKEDFEAGTGNWSTGGFASDWAWGTPAKSIINTAASGAKCWITGGLKGNYYNDNELSWVQSPCFDFTSLKYPMVTFNANWDTEQNYDGAALQYSIDGGITWQSLGAVNDAVNCLNTRWYNTSNISYLNGLSQNNGWSGNNGGMVGWHLSQHTTPFLAGKSSVIFRFVFGAGSKYNNFNGFAFDDFFITEAQPNNATFKSVCTENASILNFQSITDLCPQNYFWDFGDPASAPNVSALPSPSHQFSAPGTYTVTLTTSGPDNASFTYSQTVTVLQASVKVISPVKCFSDTSGEATVEVFGGTGNYTYEWSNLPNQKTATALHIGAGNYTVTVSQPGACTITLPIAVTQPPPLTHKVSVSPPDCGHSNGIAVVAATGGTAPYSYQWLPDNHSGQYYFNLAPGNVYAVITDANGCIDTANVTIANPNALTLNITDVKQVDCYMGKNGAIQTAVSGGTPPFKYLWAYDVSTGPSAENLHAGTYWVAVTDTAGCRDVKTVVLEEPKPLSSLRMIASTSCGLNNGSVVFSEVRGGSPPYKFGWPQGITDQYAVSNLAPDTYFVTVYDSKGCSVSYYNYIAASKPLLLQVAQTPASCFNANDAMAVATVSDYFENYTITWSGNGINYQGDSITGLSAGSYVVTATDDAACTATESITIAQPLPVTVNFITNDEICNAADGSITAMATGGSAPYQYNWQSPVANTAKINGLSAGSYKITVTDAHNCISESAAKVNSLNPLRINLGADTTICPGNTLTLSPGNFITYRWQNNTSSPAFTVTQPGNYSVTVTDAQDCIASDTIKVIEDCGDIYFPSAFSPNADGRNDQFGAIGNLSLLTNFSFVIYNRWGQIIFQSTDPRTKWDGNTKAISSGTNTFVWIAKYNYNNQKNLVKKGTVTLLR